MKTFPAPFQINTSSTPRNLQWDRRIMLWVVLWMVGVVLIASCGFPTSSSESPQIESTQESSLELETTGTDGTLDDTLLVELISDDASFSEEPAVDSSDQEFFALDTVDASEPSLLPDASAEIPQTPEFAPEMSQETQSHDNTPDTLRADTSRESPPEPRSCQENRDCSPPTCQMAGNACKQELALCEQGRCKTTTHSVSNAQCVTADGLCRFKQNICQESYEGAQLSTAIYPSESISSLPSKFKHQKTIQGASRDGTMMFFTTDTPQTVCHVVYKGVSPQSIKDLVSALSSAKAEDCKTGSGRIMGKCGTGFYAQYSALRQAGAVGYVRDWVEQWKCPGGLRLYGHSMGGAQAALLASELYTLDAKTYNKTSMRLYTFGAPRLYLTTPANQYHTSITAIRWVNEGDAVPTTPPSSLNFRHFGASYEITKSGSKVKFSAKGQDYSPTPDLFNLDGSHSYKTYSSRLQSCTGL